MRQAQPKEVKVRGYRCYIYKFGAMDATIIFGDLVKTLSPLVGLLSAFTEKGLDTVITPEMISGVFSSLDGNTLKKYIHTLLIDYENVMIEHGEETERLTENLVNNLFMGQIDGIFELMFEVIKDNYSSFFDKRESRFGKALEALTMILTDSSNTESSMIPPSQD